jgi:adenylate cyclase
MGIHAGKATAGDFGIGYGLMGGALEAAVQLRRLNRMYKTSVLVGKSVFKPTSGAVEYRKLDPVLLWGEVAPTTIYELLGEAGTIHPTSANYPDALGAYLDGDFKKAAELFGLILEKHPNDGPSDIFRRRALSLIKNPPQKWKGVYR